MLDHPSLAELLPSGVFMANDDYNNRMVAIDPAAGALVWQYGVTGKPGTAPGRLRIPDGSTCCFRTGRRPPTWHPDSSAGTARGRSWHVPFVARRTAWQRKGSAVTGGTQDPG
jgi:hypothetical protein